jgi:hypothetical protein
MTVSLTLTQCAAMILEQLGSKKRSARNGERLRHLFVRIEVYRYFMCLIRNASEGRLVGAQLRDCGATAIRCSK